jgi:hypothetical protein
VRAGTGATYPNPVGEILGVDTGALVHDAAMIGTNKQCRVFMAVWLAFVTDPAHDLSVKLTPNVDL